MELIVCGGLRIDYIITAEGEVRLRQIGGNAVYAAAGARLWTDRVALLAKAGENYPNEWLVELAGYGLATEWVRRVPGWQEMRTFYAYVDTRTRVDRDPAIHFARIGQPLPPDLEDYVDSTISHRKGRDNPMMLRREDIPLTPLDAAHIAPLAILSQEELAGGFRDAGVPLVTVDPGEYHLTPENLPLVQNICGAADAFLPSELEIELFFGKIDAREAIERIAAWGPRFIVLKRGPQGCLLYERDTGRLTTIPAYPARVVDVTGAGDSFCGAFVVGLRQSGDPVRAALMGAVAASFTIEDYGALYLLSVPREAAERRFEELAGMVRRA